MSYQKQFRNKIAEKLAEVRKWDYESVEDLAEPLETSMEFLRGFYEGGPGDAAYAVMFRSCERPGLIALRLLRTLTSHMEPHEVKDLVKRAQREHQDAENKRIKDLMEHF